jgi:uncharacterized BrkB/YihY/UPF0761 family membrane protein
MQKPRARVWGFRAMLTGLAIGIFPLVLYFFLFIGCQNPDDESSCVGALAAPLFEATMPFAFLVAFLVSMVGLVSWIVAVGRGPDARVWGFRIMLAGLVVALFPLLLSVLFSIGCENPFDESACAGAVVLWGLLATLPIGFLVSIVGLVFWIVASGRKPKA